MEEALRVGPSEPSVGRMVSGCILMVGLSSSRCFARRNRESKESGDREESRECLNRFRKVMEAK